MFVRISQIPLGALALGLAGVLPFASCVILSLIADPFWENGIRNVAYTYSLTILSFMAGCIWAFAAPHNDIQGLALSTVPALLGWVSYLLVPLRILNPEQVFYTLAVLFVLLLTLDFRAARLGQTPAWWISLRLLLTSLVTPCILILAGLMST